MKSQLTSPDRPLMRGPTIVVVHVDQEIAGRAQGGANTASTANSTSSYSCLAKPAAVGSATGTGSGSNITGSSSCTTIDDWYRRHGAPQEAVSNRVLRRLRAPIRAGGAASTSSASLSATGNMVSRSEPSIPRALSPHSESREAARLEKFANKSTSDLLQWITENRARSTLGEAELPPSDLFKKRFYDETKFLSFVHQPCVTSDKAETTRHSWPPTSLTSTADVPPRKKKSNARQASQRDDHHGDKDGDVAAGDAAPRRAGQGRRAKRHKNKVEQLKRLGILMRDSDDGCSSRDDTMESSSFGSDNSVSLNARCLRPPIVRSMVMDGPSAAGPHGEKEDGDSQQDGPARRDYIPRDMPSSASSSSSSSSSADEDSSQSEVSDVEPEVKEGEADSSMDHMPTVEPTQGVPALEKDASTAGLTVKRAAKPSTNKSKAKRKKQASAHPRATARREARLKAKESQLKSIYSTKTAAGTGGSRKQPGKRADRPMPVASRAGLMSPFTDLTLMKPTDCQDGALPSARLQQIHEQDDDNHEDIAGGIQGSLIPSKETSKHKKHRGRETCKREPAPRRRRQRNPKSAAAAEKKAPPDDASETSSEDDDKTMSRVGTGKASSDEDNSAMKNMKKLLEARLKQKAELQKKRKVREEKRQREETALPSTESADPLAPSKSANADKTGAATKKAGKAKKGARAKQTSRLPPVPEHAAADSAQLAESGMTPAVAESSSQKLGTNDTGSAEKKKTGKAGSKASSEDRSRSGSKVKASSRGGNVKKLSTSTTSAASSTGTTTAAAVGAASTAAAKGLSGGDLAVNSKAADFSSGRDGGGITVGREPQTGQSGRKAEGKGGKKRQAASTVPVSQKKSKQQQQQQQQLKKMMSSNVSRSRFPSSSSGPSPTSSTIATIRARDIRSRGLAEDDLMAQNPQVLKYEKQPSVVEVKDVVKVTKRPRQPALTKLKAPAKKSKEQEAKKRDEQLEKQKTLSSLAALLVQDNHRVKHADTFRMREKGKPRVQYVPQIPGMEKTKYSKKLEEAAGRLPLADMPMNESPIPPSLQKARSEQKMKEAIQRRGKEKMEQRFKQLMRFAKRELGHQYGIEYRRGSGFDQLAQFCIVEDAKLELYAKAFAVEDTDEDGILNEEQLRAALESLYTIAHISPQQLEYVLKVLECDPCINFKMFAVVAALCERIGTLDKDTRMFLDGLNLASIEKKMSFYKQLFIGSSDGASGRTINADDLRIELKAGGLPREMENHIVQQCDDENLGTISFLDYMAYIPLFVQMHETIVDNPFDSFAEAFGLASAGHSSEASTCNSTAQYRHESIVVDVLRSPKLEDGFRLDGSCGSDSVFGGSNMSSSANRSGAGSSSMTTRNLMTSPPSSLSMSVSSSTRLAMLQEAQERRQRQKAELAQSVFGNGTAGEACVLARDQAIDKHDDDNPGLAGHGADENKHQSDTQLLADSAPDPHDSSAHCTQEGAGRTDQDAHPAIAGGKLPHTTHGGHEQEIASSSTTKLISTPPPTGDPEKPEATNTTSLIDINDVEVAVSRAQSRESSPSGAQSPEASGSSLHEVMDQSTKSPASVVANTTGIATQQAQLKPTEPDGAEAETRNVTESTDGIDDHPRTASTQLASMDGTSEMAANRERSLVSTSAAGEDGDDTTATDRHGSSSTAMTTTATATTSQAPRWHHKGKRGGGAAARYVRRRHRKWSDENESPDESANTSSTGVAESKDGTNDTTANRGSIGAGEIMDASKGTANDATANTSSKHSVREHPCPLDTVMEKANTPDHKHELAPQQSTSLVNSGKHLDTTGANVSLSTNTVSNQQETNSSVIHPPKEQPGTGELSLGALSVPPQLDHAAASQWELEQAQLILSSIPDQPPLVIHAHSVSSSSLASSGDRPAKAVPVRRTTKRAGRRRRQSESDDSDREQAKRTPKRAKARVQRQRPGKVRRDSDSESDNGGHPISKTRSKPAARIRTPESSDNDAAATQSKQSKSVAKTGPDASVGDDAASRTRPNQDKALPRGGNRRQRPTKQDVLSSPGGSGSDNGPSKKRAAAGRARKRKARRKVQRRGSSSDG